MSDETSNSEEKESENESESESESEERDERKKKKKSTKKSLSKSKVKQVKRIQTKINVSRSYNEYYSVKLKVDKENVPVKQLVKHLKALYKQLQAIDPSLIIYEYNSERPSEAILKPKDTPTDISAMKKFFSNISVKPNGGHTWFQVWLGHDDSIANVLTNMKYWSTEKDSQLYHKRLQQKYTSKDYWLMWSTERLKKLPKINFILPLPSVLFEKMLNIPELSSACQLINLWNNLIRKKKGCNISSKYLQQVAKKLGVSQPMQLSLQDCELERKNASRNYQNLKRNAQQSRTLFMHDLAAQHAARGNESLSNAILRMTRKEELRSSYRRIRNVTKPFLTSINNPPNEEATTTDKETIEKALSKENIKKFTTAYSSPFLQKPLSRLLGQTATSPTAQKILNGTFSDRIKLSKSTKIFIQHLKMPTSILNNSSNDSQCSLSTAKHIGNKKERKPILQCHKDI